MLMCNGIVVVSQFYPYPLTLCFNEQGEGVGIGVGEGVYNRIEIKTTF